MSEAAEKGGDSGDFPQKQPAGDASDVTELDHEHERRRRRWKVTRFERVSSDCKDILVCSKSTGRISYICVAATPIFRFYTIASSDLLICSMMRFSIYVPSWSASRSNVIFRRHLQARKVSGKWWHNNLTTREIRKSLLARNVTSNGNDCARCDT